MSGRVSASEIYSKLIEIAQDLGAFSGYVAPGRPMKERSTLQGQFNFARDTLLDELHKRFGEWPLVAAQVSSDLDAIAARRGAYEQGNIAFVREALLDQIDVEQHRGPLARAFVRWGPFVLAIVFAAILLLLAK